MSGQPISIAGATGPEFAYTVVFWNLCDQLDLEFLPARVWQASSLPHVFSLASIICSLYVFQYPLFSMTDWLLFRSLVLAGFMVLAVHSSARRI